MSPINATTSPEQEVDTRTTVAPVTTTNPSWRTTYLGAGDGVDAKNVSWGAILAGIATTIAILVAFSLLGTAIGLGVTDPTSNQPFEGVGTGLAVWAIVTLAIAVAAGGFVTGILAGRGGFIHGIVTWAGSIIAAAIVVSLAASAALGAVGAVLSTTASTVGSVGSVAAGAVDGATDGIVDALGEVEFEGVQEQTEAILTGTDVPELQPGYLQGQIQESRDDILGAGRALLSDPDQYEEILSDLGSSLSERAEIIGAAVDREAIATSVAANTDLTGPEAEALTDDIADGLEAAAQTARDELSTVDVRIQELQAQVTVTVEEARETADEVANRAAVAAGWAFAGVLLALAVSAFAGLLGARLVDQGPVRPTQA